MINERTLFSHFTNVTVFVYCGYQRKSGLKGNNNERQCFCVPTAECVLFGVKSINTGVSETILQNTMLKKKKKKVHNMYEYICSTTWCDRELKLTFLYKCINFIWLYRVHGSKIIDIV